MFWPNLSEGISKAPVTIGDCSKCAKLLVEHLAEHGVDTSAEIHSMWHQHNFKDVEALSVSGSAPSEVYDVVVRWPT